MDGKTRKRKMENEEESEEEKIEKFFALIRSTREVHEHITGRTLVRPKVNGEKKKSSNDEKANGWKPSFQPQDFMGNDARLKSINFHQESLLPGPLKKKEDLMTNARLKTLNIDQESLDRGPSKKEDGLDLDLKL